MITWVFVPLSLILPDQPNRVVRTRMLRGVGGRSCEAPHYPDRAFIAHFFSFDVIYTIAVAENSKKNSASSLAIS